LNHSLRGVETLTTEWWKGPSLRPRPVLAGRARRRDDGVLARRDRTSPIDLLAARYPVIRRLVGAPSFRVAARRFILSEPPSAPIPRRYGDSFPRFIRSLGNTACIACLISIPPENGFRDTPGAEAQVLAAESRHDRE
jgi:hypothetical protein